MQPPGKATSIIKRQMVIPQNNTHCTPLQQLSIFGLIVIVNVNGSHRSAAQSGSIFWVSDLLMHLMQNGPQVVWRFFYLF